MQYERTFDHRWSSSKPLIAIRSCLIGEPGYEPRSTIQSPVLPPRYLGCSCQMNLSAAVLNELLQCDWIEPVSRFGRRG